MMYLQWLIRPNYIKANIVSFLHYLFLKEYLITWYQGIDVQYFFLEMYINVKIFFHKDLLRLKI